MMVQRFVAAVCGPKHEDLTYQERHERVAAFADRRLGLTLYRLSGPFGGYAVGSKEHLFLCDTFRDLCLYLIGKTIDNLEPVTDVDVETKPSEGQ